MQDRELLKLAAKAARIYYLSIEEQGLSLITGKYWNPLEDDGDALRLAVQLDMMIDTVNRVVAGYYSEICIDVDFDEQGADPFAAVRRTIVRAAAEIGKAME